MSRTEAISLYQPLLFSIAIKMVGKMEDAEDIVQDTFAKWLSIDTKKIKNTKAYLAQSVRNNCLQFLNSLRNKISQKTTSVDDHVELTDHNQIRSLFHFDLEAQMNEAWVVLHRKLEPLEKSIFVMREIFNVEYEELQYIFGKSREHCRQLFHRAKTKIGQERNKFKFLNLGIPESFKKACYFGQFSDLISDFKNDVVDKLPSRK